MAEMQTVIGFTCESRLGAGLGLGCGSGFRTRMLHPRLWKSKLMHYQISVRLDVAVESTQN